MLSYLSYPPYSVHLIHPSILRTNEATLALLSAASEQANPTEAIAQPESKQTPLSDVSSLALPHLTKVYIVRDWRYPYGLHPTQDRLCPYRPTQLKNSRPVQVQDQSRPSSVCHHTQPNRHHSPVHYLPTVPFLPGQHPRSRSHVLRALGLHREARMHRRLGLR